jgi:hypothetical protein
LFDHRQIHNPRDTNPITDPQEAPFGLHLSLGIASDPGPDPASRGSSATATQEHGLANTDRQVPTRI